MQAKAEAAIQQKLLEATKNIEKQVDAAIEQLGSLDVNDLEGLRKQRVRELKALQSKKEEWLQKGHGSYEQLAEEKMFFDVVKSSENVVIHFFTPTSSRSPILDKHLKILAPKHIETKFACLNAEKCPFLAERLKIKTIPTLVCVQNGDVVDKIIGFTSLGNRDDFTTDVLEWRLAQNKIIEYEGDILTPPDQQHYKKEKHQQGRGIRDGKYNYESDDDLEIEDHLGKFPDMPDLLSLTPSGKKSGMFDLTAEEEAELGLNDEDKKS